MTINHTEWQDLKQVIMAGIADSAIEWYDFSIYATASALVFSDLLFPDLDKLTVPFAAFATYALAFITKPFGGLFFTRIRIQILGLEDFFASQYCNCDFSGEAVLHNFRYSGQSQKLISDRILPS